jgi:hypothetical protein
MSVHIDELTSEVVTEGTDRGVAPQPGAGGESGTVWQEQARFRALRERALRDALRTQAEGYGD